MPTSFHILEKAAQHQRDRAATYDQPGGERSAARIAQAFNAITGRTGDCALSEAEAWLFLQVLKQVRLFTAPGYHADSAEDNVSYAALLAEAKSAEVVHGQQAADAAMMHTISSIADAWWRNGVGLEDNGR